MGLKRKIYKIIRSWIFAFTKIFIPELSILKEIDTKTLRYLTSRLNNCSIHPTVKLYPPYHLNYVVVEKGSYINVNSRIYLTEIGRFCSIGPNLVCGGGIHPTNGISTSPMFYSTKNQNGFSYSQEDKIIEHKQIKIGNDVFIGMNVTILDGVEIGDGVVIGAGSVVVDNIPPYAIAVGVPAKVIKYRFSVNVIDELIKIKWWTFDDKNIKLVEKHFYNVEEFIKVCKDLQDK